MGALLLLSLVAVPNFFSYRQRGFNARALADLENAFTASMAHFIDYEGACVDNNKIHESGMVQSKGVKLEVIRCHQDDLSLATWHTSGSRYYLVDATGVITFFNHRLNLDKKIAELRLTE